MPAEPALNADMAGPADARWMQYRSRAAAGVQA